MLLDTKAYGEIENELIPDYKDIEKRIFDGLLENYCNERILRKIKSKPSFRKVAY